MLDKIFGLEDDAHPASSENSNESIVTNDRAQLKGRLRREPVDVTRSRSSALDIPEGIAPQVVHDGTIDGLDPVQSTGTLSASVEMFGNRLCIRLRKSSAGKFLQEFLAWTFG